MKKRRWFGSSRFELWLSAIILVCLVGAVGPSVLEDVVSVQSPGNWAMLVVWVRRGRRQHLSDGRVSRQGCAH